MTTVTESNPERPFFCFMSTRINFSIFVFPFSCSERVPFTRFIIKHVNVIYIQWFLKTKHKKTTFLSPYLQTDVVDSMELEYDVTTTAMTKDLPRLEILASVLKIVLAQPIE